MSSEEHPQADHPGTDSMTISAERSRARREAARATRRRRSIRRRCALGLALLAAVAMVGVLIGSAPTGPPAGHSRPLDAQIPSREPSPGVAAPGRGRSANGEAAAIDRVLAYTPYVAVGTRRGREVALSFDDGPTAYTRPLLAVLRRERVLATFFEIGAQVSRFPALTRMEVREGFAIGDHTEGHPFMAALDATRQRAELLAQAAALRSAGAPFPRLFRPPYGSFNSTTVTLLGQLRMLMVLWTVDTGDYARPGVARIVYTALSGARPGAIILMHDGGGDRSQTVAALPRIIRGLRRRGYRLVTVPRLMADDPPPHDQPRPRALSGA